MKERSDRINSRLDDLAPAERDHVKQAIRSITAEIIARPAADYSEALDVHSERRVA